MIKYGVKNNSNSVQHMSQKGKAIDNKIKIDNAYGNNDSDNYDDDFEDSQNEGLVIKNASLNRSKANYLNTNMIKEDNKVNRSHYNGLSGQRSEGILSSAHGNYSVNSVKGDSKYQSNSKYALITEMPYKRNSYTRNSNKSYISRSKYTMSLLAEKFNMQPQPHLEKVQNCLLKCK